MSQTNETTNNKTINDVPDNATIEVKAFKEAICEVKSENEQKFAKLEEKMDRLSDGFRNISEIGFRRKIDSDSGAKEMIEFKEDIQKSMSSKQPFQREIKSSDFEVKDVNRMDVNTLGGYLNRVQYQTPINETIKSDIIKCNKKRCSNNF